MKKLFNVQWQQYFCALAIIIFCYSQSFALGDEATWESLYQTSDVEISYRYDECHRPDQGTHKEYAFLQFKNLTDNIITVEFEKEMWYNGKCLTCGKPGDEYTFTLTLEPGQQIEGSCEGNNDRALMIFSKMVEIPSSSVLTDFKLKNITIKN